MTDQSSESKRYDLNIFYKKYRCNSFVPSESLAESKHIYFRALNTLDPAYIEYKDAKRKVRVHTVRLRLRFFLLQLMGCTGFNATVHCNITSPHTVHQKQKRITVANRTV